MNAERNVEYLTALALAVTEFRDRLTELLTHYVPFGEFIARGIAPAVVPRDGADRAEIQRLTAQVSRAAGRAAEAVLLTGSSIEVAGLGRIDPIAAWLTITQPKPVLEPDDVLGACESILGRLDTMILKAQAEAPPTIGAAAMHPLIWSAARRLWNDGHFGEAVTRACESLIARVKAETGRNDVAETSLWQETFSAKPPEPGKPRLRWPGNPTDRTVAAMNEGLRAYAPGVQLLIRNPSVHRTNDMPQQEALERLAALSLLARWLDDCGLLHAPSPEEADPRP